jgi:hypothetical protein|nr:MAG TPA: hypothetical protein [Caudoviricetes sp.]
MTSAQKERLILRLENLYDSMGNTVDILVSHRDEVPEVDQWVDDLESDMGILTEWINFLRDYDN